MYEAITYEGILGRMLDSIPNNVDKREGSVIWDALAPAAAELKLMYIELDDIMRQSFADTASREYLMRRAAERGMAPYPATKAVLRGEFEPGHIDLTGKRFSMPNTNMRYAVREKISSDEGKSLYRLECETAGSEGNHYLGKIIPIDYINGLQSAELTDLPIPAKDEEDTESLRYRYLSSFDEQAYGGNVKDYLEKTNALEDVGATKVTPHWQGGGTVKLTILNGEYQQASPTLVDKVQQTIDPTRDGLGVGIAPIGHIVTVDTVQPAYVEITADITFHPGFLWADAEAEATRRVEEYLLELRKGWANKVDLEVVLADIVTRIYSVPEVYDIQNTCINGAAENLRLAGNEIPMLGGIVPNDA